jgi:hypothetical protein
LDVLPALETLSFHTCTVATTQCLPEFNPDMSRRHTTRPGAAGQDNLLGWTIFIVLLAVFAALSWIGSFYIFGHPENGFSYRVLRALGKIEPPRRFELTKAPRGQFLDADKLFQRFSELSPAGLAAENDKLLRNYLRNYQHTKDRVPYVIGSFNVMGAFRLGPKNFFTSGVVALARSKENPSVLLELVFPAEEKNAANLERMLLTGLDLQLARTLDLTAVINARITPDGRLHLTAVPLLYGSYTSTDATGTFSLEPPDQLNVAAGLPMLNQAAVEKAAAHYRQYLQRAGLPDDEPAGAAVLMRVQKPQPADPDALPEPPALPETATEMLDGMPVARAVPVDTVGEEIPVARAEPVTATFPDAPALPSPAPSPTPPAPTPTPAAELQPFSEAAAPTPALPAATGPRNWTLYDAGRMPRGRLLDANAARQLAGQGAPGQPVYLSGEFSVTNTGGGRAIMRGRRAARNVRIIADFPDGTIPPPQGQTFRRDSTRPFQINRVEESPDGVINIYVREITRP